MTVHYSTKIRCACVIGTRPEVIKMAPVIRALRRSDWATPVVISTGQQDDLLDRAMADFRLRSDYAIPYDSRGADIVPTFGSIASRLSELLDVIRPSVVVAQGDTTTVFAASVVAFYRRIPFVHVEAGLRTGDLAAPFPEEFHRRSIAIGTHLHCAPTEAAAANLRRENIPDDRILTSGNTVIDALLETAAARSPARPSPRAAS